MNDSMYSISPAHLIIVGSVAGLSSQQRAKTNAPHLAYNRLRIVEKEPRFSGSGIVAVFHVYKFLLLSSYEPE